MKDLDCIRKVNEIKPKELAILIRLYLSKEFPGDYLTMRQIERLIQCNEKTAGLIVKDLTDQGFLTELKSSVKFIYVAKEKEDRDLIRNLLKQKLNI